MSNFFFNHKWKNRLFILGLLGLTLFVFKGVIFRSMISYQVTKERKTYQLTNAELLQLVTDEFKTLNDVAIAEIISRTQKLTTKQLSFTFQTISSNPNNCFLKGQANCIGYSALFESIGNNLIRSQELQDHYQVKHVVGKVFVMGVDIHQWLQDPFWKDHDFNLIENVQTGEVYAVDPSVYDYFGISKVRLQ